MAGSSAGGLISTYAMCKYPSIYKKVAALSNAYWINQKDIENFAEKSDLTDIKRFYFDVGTKGETASFDSSAYLNSNISFKNVIANKSINYHFTIIEDAVHNEKSWREQFPNIIKYLFED